MATKTVIENLKAMDFLDADSVGYLVSKLAIKHYKKGEKIGHWGDKYGFFAFVSKGIARAYRAGKGTGKTIYFVRKGDWFCEIEELDNIYSSDIIIEAISDCELSIISQQELSWSFKFFRGTERFSRVITEKFFMNIIRNETESIALTPQRRYLQFIDRNKDIIMEITQSEICLILSVERETLSRIRRRIAIYDAKINNKNAS